MSLPGSVTMVTVTADERRADGTAPAGTVTFIPSVRSVVANTTITIDPVTVQLVDGQASIPLAWQDDPDLTPHGWTYTVILTVGADSRTWVVKLPQTGPVALDSLAPVDEVVPTSIRVLSVNDILPDVDGNVVLPASQGSAPSTRVIGTTGGLQGGGDLSADRTLSPVYGSAAGTVCQGNDGRLSDARTPLAHTHVQSDITGLAAALAAKATKLVVRQAWITSGDVSPLPNTGVAWQALGAPFELQLPAVAGDYVELAVNALRLDTSGNSWLDLGVFVGSSPGSIVRFLSSGGAAAGFEGDPGWTRGTGYAPRSGPRGFVVQVGDLDGSNVRFVVVVKSNGTGTLNASANYPFFWRAINYGPVG